MNTKQIFIKTGYWSQTKKPYNGWLNLSDLISTGGNPFAPNLQQIKLSLSAAEINNIGTTPILAIAAPGASKFIKVLDVTGRLIWNSVAFDNNIISLANTANGTYYLSLSSTLVQTGDYMEIGGINGTPKTAVNSAVFIEGTDSVSIGDSTLDLYITYEIVTL